MKCPHCLVEFHDNPSSSYLGVDTDYYWEIVTRLCAACERYIFYLSRSSITVDERGSKRRGGLVSVTQVYPHGSSRPPVPTQVLTETPDIAQDYTEACLVLPESAKASAALSRRCLQHILEQKAGVNTRDLGKQIDELLASGKLPSHIADSIDAVRWIGNFAAHAIKAQNTGAIVDVEPGEAEWNLDTIEMLFDFYYVQPDVTRQKRAALNQKLQDAGRPLLK